MRKRVNTSNSSTQCDHEKEAFSDSYENCIFPKKICTDNLLLYHLNSGNTEKQLDRKRPLSASDDNRTDDSDCYYHREDDESNEIWDYLKENFFNKGSYNIIQHEIKLK